MSLTRRVVLLGWDAADWKVIQPLVDAGKMPAMRRLIETGVSGDLASLDPMISPLLWTSIATGHTADRHGILSFLEPDPVSGGARPVTSASRRVPAIWNILERCGIRCAVVNWFATHPAEKIEGIVVSDQFAKATVPPGKPWPVPAASVHPASLTKTFEDLRIHPADITGDDLVPFVPLLERIDQATDKRPLQLAAELAGTITVHGVATHIAEHEQWDLLAVYLGALDHIGHHFMPFHPPRLEGTPEDLYEIYNGVVEGMYRFHDMMLARLMQLAGPDSVFVIVSDHGFHSDHLRPRGTSLAWTEEQAARWHRPHGVFCASGPGLRRDELVFGANLLDIAPFVLSLFGVPAGADMPGRILPDAFGVPPNDSRIPTWAQESADEPAFIPEWDTREALAQLADLGYIEPISDERAKQLSIANAHRDYCLARVHMGAGRFEEAIPALERSIEEKDEPAVRLTLAQCLFRTGRLAECRTQAESVLARNPGRAHAHLIRAILDLAEGRTRQGLEGLLAAEKFVFPTGSLHYRIGRAYMELRQWDAAERALRRAIEIDSGMAPAYSALSRVLLDTGRSEEAAEAALDAVRLRYEDAGAHAVLGAALARIGQIDRGVQALETSVRLRPSAWAHEALAAIHEQATRDTERADTHRKEAQRLSKR